MVCIRDVQCSGVTSKSLILIFDKLSGKMFSIKLIRILAICLVRKECQL